MSTEQSSSASSCSYARTGTVRHGQQFCCASVNQRGRKANEASTSVWADLWRDVWREVEAWGGLGDTLLVRKVKTHTTPEAVLAGVITTDDRAGNDLADAACKLVNLEHRAPRSVRAARDTANLAVTRMAHWIARIGSARQRLEDPWAWASDYETARACATLVLPVATAPSLSARRAYVCR